MDWLIRLLQIAGAVQLAIALANLALPRTLGYRENLARVSALVRQIFIVHSVFIVLVVVLFGLLSLFFAAELAGGAPLGRFLAWVLAVFWLLRLGVQLFYYDREVKRRYPLQNLAMTAAVIYLGLVYLAAAILGGAA